MTRETFTPDDIQQLERRGLTVDAAREQIDILRDPPAAVKIVRPCTIGDGITKLSVEEEEHYAALGGQAAAAGRVLKFVPASGAASRMFKDLIAALEDETTRPSASKARLFFERLEDFPFANLLLQRGRHVFTAGIDQRTGGWSHFHEDDERRILRILLEDLAYASRPKGLIPFHRDGSEVRTAFEDQLIEACAYAKSDDGRCRVHFTVSPESQPQFEEELTRVAPRLRERFGCDVEVTFSIQHRSTDTLAINDQGEPFRTEEGELLFRPGGHGALLRNLGALDAEIISIKNIDNILPAAANSEGVRWKQILVGRLAELRVEVFEALRNLDDESSVDAAVALVGKRFHRVPDEAAPTLEEKRRFVLNALNRPIRVVGAVKNEGEPGGAPFWSRNASGEISIQIVESSQVDMSDAAQRDIWNSSTHFNPVDIVCSLHDAEGTAYDLQKFVNRRAVFVAKKSHEGRELAALELPGLWNGAMEGWNTVVIDVPASTFAPVKTVFDLLRPQHQPQG